MFSIKSNLHCNFPFSDMAILLLQMKQQPVSKLEM